MSDQEGRSETVTSDETGTEEVTERPEAEETKAEEAKGKAKKARTASGRTAKSGKTAKNAKTAEAGKGGAEPSADETAEKAAKDDQAADDTAADSADSESAASSDSAPETSSAAKKRLPRAQDISGGAAGFTPHGLSRRSGARGTPKPLSPAAKRRRRRRTILGAVTVVVVLAAGAGTYYAFRPSTEIEVSGAFNKQPKITLPKIKPAATLQSRNLIEGKGAKVATGDMVVINYVGYAWRGKTNKQLISSYKTGQPESLTIGQVVPGIDKGLSGKKAGSRVLLSIPPKDGFGAQGNPQLGVQGTDTLVFVIDVLGAYGKNTATASGSPRELDKDLPEITDKGAGKPPEVKIPDADPPEELKAETLVDGGGPAVTKGQSLVVHYEGRLWRNGKIFDSSWQSQQPPPGPQPAPTPGPQPLLLRIGVGKVVPGWDKGLVGKKVGSRVLLVLPPKEGYGEKGAPGGAIKGDDTLVFVVDILGAH